MTTCYTVLIANSAQKDIKDFKNYILKQFGYRETAEHFSKRIRMEIEALAFFSTKHCSTTFNYRSYTVYLKPWNTYLLFYIIDEKKRKVVVLRVMKDRMDWKTAIAIWTQKH